MRGAVCNTGFDHSGTRRAHAMCFMYDGQQHDWLDELLHIWWEHLRGVAGTRRLPCCEFATAWVATSWRNRPLTILIPCHVRHRVTAFISTASTAQSRRGLAGWTSTAKRGKCSLREMQLHFLYTSTPTSEHTRATPWCTTLQLV
jgi:hypothetical protein